jgi:hypothetical protein
MRPSGSRPRTLCRCGASPGSRDTIQVYNEASYHRLPRARSAPWRGRLRLRRAWPARLVSPRRSVPRAHTQVLQETPAELSSASPRPPARSAAACLAGEHAVPSTATRLVRTTRSPAEWRACPSGRCAGDNAYRGTDYHGAATASSVILAVYRRIESVPRSLWPVPGRAAGFGFREVVPRGSSTVARNQRGTAPEVTRSLALTRTA